MAWHQVSVTFDCLCDGWFAQSLLYTYCPHQQLETGGLNWWSPLGELWQFNPDRHVMKAVWHLWLTLLWYGRNHFQCHHELIKWTYQHICVGNLGEWFCVVIMIKSDHKRWIIISFWNIYQKVSKTAFARINIASKNRLYDSQYKIDWCDHIGF
jgi:hypothetical protein